MQAQGSQLQPSKDGILVVSGFATSLRIDHGHLVVRTGEGRLITEARFSRVHRPRIRRLVVFGKGGYTTWEALAWLHAVGCSFVNISRDGDFIATSGGIHGGQASLRRAQAFAMGSEVGKELTRLSLDAKLTGQRRIVEERLDDEAAVGAIDHAIDMLRDAKTVEEAMSAEAQAAVAYWSAWEHMPVTFARTDVDKIPEHWAVVGGRRSALTVTSPRLATSPAQALINYVYGLAEFASTINLRTAGLDPDLGWLHRDASYRASAALDVMEAIRSFADEFVLDLIQTRTFSRREFGELASGQVRLSSSLAKPIAQGILPLLETSAWAIVEQVVEALSGVRAGSRTGRRRAPVKRGRVDSRPLRAGRPTATLTSACRMCGVVLDGPDRVICDECLPSYGRERTVKLATSGKATLAAMRESAADPARSPKASAKKREKSRSTSLAMRAWERAHGKPDHKFYEREVLPLIRDMTVPQLTRLTGLSQFHCWKVRKGERRLHARHWAAVQHAVRGRGL
jgi:CRISPR-associated protein Cas1